MLTPPDYLERFLRIPVHSADDAWDPVTVCVDRYRLNTSQRAPKVMNERARLAKKVAKDLAMRRAQDPAAGITVRVDDGSGPTDRTFASFATAANDPLWALMRYPYVGKGSPEAIAVALQLAAVDLPGSPPIVAPDAFQTYCDTWLGLDCNGFVGNYLRHVLAGVAWDDVNSTKGLGPDSDIATIWQKFPGTAVARADDVVPAALNLIVLTNGQGQVIPGGPGGVWGHVLLSGPNESTRLDGLKNALGVETADAICTAESTAAVDPAEHRDGLFRGWSAYVDQPGQPGVLRLYRALGGAPLRVRMKAMAWAG